MTRTTTITRPASRNWLGRAGTHQEFRFDRSHTGRRVSFITWQDTGETEVRVINGDGRKPGFELLHATTLMANADPATFQNIATALASVYFVKG
jgi:hypothetical protein